MRPQLHPQRIRTGHHRPQISLQRHKPGLLRPKSSLQSSAEVPARPVEIIRPLFVRPSYPSLQCSQPGFRLSQLGFPCLQVWDMFKYDKSFWNRFNCQIRDHFDAKSRDARRVDFDRKNRGYQLTNMARSPCHGQTERPTDRQTVRWMVGGIEGLTHPIKEMLVVFAMCFQSQISGERENIE